VNITREEHLQHVDEYKNRLEPLMERLQADGKWKLVRRERFDDYFKGGNQGLLLVHQVL
jgi:hypothetical protein